MRLYTRRGDDGTTDLLGGRRARKTDARIEAIGAVDELNAALGLAAACCTTDELKADLLTLQHRLFDLGADLASADGQAQPRIGVDHVTELERMIDRHSDAVEPLRQFILPGGTELAARVHVARGVCRRAERRCVALAGAAGSPADDGAASDDPGGHLPGGVVVHYLNRTSDLLFALARRANAVAGVGDVAWEPGAGS
jgi:cob(I)alamin adenosyltransferase